MTDILQGTLLEHAQALDSEADSPADHEVDSPSGGPLPLTRTELPSSASVLIPRGRFWRILRADL